VAEELLVLLHSYYPDFVSIGMIHKCMDRRSKTGISNALKKLWDTKLVYKEDSNYVLTQPGFVSAVEVLNKISGV
jgi:predicted transcriptional regulator